MGGCSTDKDLVRNRDATIAKLIKLDVVPDAWKRRRAGDSVCTDVRLDLDWIRNDVTLIE